MQEVTVSREETAMSHWQWIDLAGYGASALVFCAFYMRRMAPLRTIAVASNVAFIAYGLGRGLYPVLILHVVLLPLNCLRLVQEARPPGRVPPGTDDSPALAWLTPLLARRRCRAGEVLFSAGDPAGSMFVVLRGAVRIAENGATYGPGSPVGELGILAPGSVRAGTAVCATDAEVGSITAERVHERCRRDTLFCLCLVTLLVEPPAAAVEHAGPGASAPARPRLAGPARRARPLLDSPERAGAVAHAWAAAS
jgi:hypothetical protein